MDHGVGLAILVEDGVQHPPEVQFEDRVFDPALIYRETGNQRQQREGATVVSSCALDFLRRIITRVAEFVTSLRRFFVFTLAKDGNPQVKEERGVKGKKIKVEEAAAGACEPELAEIIVSEKEATTHAESETVKLLDDEDFERNCTRQITVEHEQFVTCDGADNHRAACQIECASPSDPHLQKSANSVTCEPSMTFSSELNDGHCTPQHDKSHSQDASREELRDDGIRTKGLTIEATSGACDSKLETSVEESAIEQVASSKSVNRNFSIRQLNAMVAEQLIKYLQALERSIVPAAILNQKTTHWRAIILATLVAVTVWARNSKHLHESMPCIKGSSINVHIRSRL